MRIGRFEVVKCVTVLNHAVAWESTTEDIAAATSTIARGRYPKVGRNSGSCAIPVVANLRVVCLRVFFHARKYLVGAILPTFFSYFFLRRGVFQVTVVCACVETRTRFQQDRADWLVSVTPS